MKKALDVVAKMVKEGRLKELSKIIKRAQKKLIDAGCEKFYDFKYKDGKFHIIEKTSFIEKAKALCGYYILETTKVDMEEKEIESHYKQLKFVEDSFRQLKDLVEIRPIFHWKVIEVFGKGVWWTPFLSKKGVPPQKRIDKGEKCKWNGLRY